MIREHKYKAWDGKVMHDKFVIMSTKTTKFGAEINEGIRDLQENAENWHMLEFSGELDDEQVELFEGDVFENTAAKWVVVFNRGCFCGRIIQGKELNPLIMLIPNPSITHLALRSIKGKKKIGNCFINPELLKV